ncbi:sulfite exporter TauE/SafE family protein [Aestuariibius sp. HNIBRBA575]|uniref:sulfite exporter TauE/SafE family protein n=1 Tax=Aestuariibius sp. HNIBRBA575 TaxID=3233343 RepID=UPI0034A25E09
MEFDLNFFMWAVPAVLFAAVSKSGFGSGASFASAAILALVLTPGEALGVMLPLLMLVDVTSLKPYWRKWDWGASKAVIIGAIPGVAMGAALYAFVPADLFRLMIGLMCLLFVGWRWAGALGWLRADRRPISNILGGLSGFVGGFTSFVAHAGGPPVAMYLLRLGRDKTTFQASTILIFWGINGMKFIPYAFLGIFTWQTMLADLFLAPVAIFGAWLGVRAHYLISERAFFTLSYVLLVLTGLRLIWIAV